MDGGARRSNHRAPVRTVKSCGPDTQKMVSSSAAFFPPATVAKGPGRRGEHEEAVKTIVQGTRMNRLNRWGLCRVLLNIAREAAVLGRPAFPAPSVFEGGDFTHNSGASRREDAGVCR